MAVFTFENTILFLVLALLVFALVGDVGWRPIALMVVVVLAVAYATGHLAL